MERLEQRLQVAKQALVTLKEIVDRPTVSIIERDAAIQRFEYTVEATWRVAQRFLNIVEGLDTGSPKTVIRMSREVGLLDEEQSVLALEMIDDRNLTAHTYNETIAKKIFNRLQPYAALMAFWIKRIEERSVPSS